MELKYLIMDVDGTLTDGKIYMSSEGELVKAFNIKDGCGIRIAIEKGIIPVIITGRNSQIVARRCKELGINQIYQGVNNKLDVLKSMGCSLKNVSYIGDDINDKECILAVKECGGVTGCPADSAREILEIADIVCSRNGGEGAVREFIEKII